jgi:hypothetical protein
MTKNNLAVVDLDIWKEQLIRLGLSGLKVNAVADALYLSIIEFKSNKEDRCHIR